MPVDRDSALLPPLDEEHQDDPSAWSLRLQALAELRDLGQHYERPKPPIRLTEDQRSWAGLPSDG